MAGGSSHTFVAESSDECARVVTGVTPQSRLLPLLLPPLLVLLLLLFPAVIETNSHERVPTH